MIDRDTIDRIRDQVSITALVGEVVKLVRRGRSHVGLCPFHQEKTPSFHVDEERGFYHCFGCGVSGDVFRFLEQHAGLSFGEAVRQLAERAGVEVEEREPGPEQTRDEEARRRRQSLYDTANSAAGFFEHLLETHARAQDARDSLADNAVVRSGSADPVSELVAGFRLGYAPPEGDALESHLGRAGLPPSSAIALGLLATADEERPVRDRLQHRLVLPVHDRHGRVVAFYGQALRPVTEGAARSDGGETALVGSPPSPIFRPQQVLYGLHQARQSLRGAGGCLLARHPLEAVALHAHGLTESVATVGMALAPEQALLLRRFTEHVVLLLPDDESTTRHVAASGEAARSAGLLVRVACLPSGLSTQQILAAQGAEAIRRIVAAARGQLEFLIDSQLDSRLSTDDPGTQLAKLGRVTELLGREPDPIVRALAEQYADAVVRRLGLPEAGSLREFVRRVRRVGTSGPGDAGRDGAEAELAPPLGIDPTQQIGREVFAAVLDQPSVLADAEVVAALSHVQGEPAAAIAATFRAWDQRSRIDREVLLSRLAPALRIFAERRLDRPVHEDAALAKLEILTRARRLRSW